MTQEMIRTMNLDPIVLAMANPTPEILPDEAAAAGAAIVGRPDAPTSQPDQQRGGIPRHSPRALDARAAAITENMKIAAA